MLSVTLVAICILLRRPGVDIKLLTEKELAAWAALGGPGLEPVSARAL